MASLFGILNIPTTGTVPICEVGGRLCRVPQREAMSLHLDGYPVIYMNHEINNYSNMGSSNISRNVLMPVNEGVVKRITRTFFECGFAAALDEARNMRTVATSPIIAAVAQYTFQFLEFLGKCKTRMFPLTLRGVESIAYYSETRDWLNSYIRCIVWHPNCFKIAVAGSDDVIRVYSDEASMVPVLKSHEQRWITCMAWRPFSAGELAVGCQRGVCVWTIDSTVHITRTSSQVTFLKHSKNCLISALQWKPDGTLLATASFEDKTVLIWDVDRLQSIALKEISPPCSSLRWSIDGNYIFACTVSSPFRVWCFDSHWNSEQWNLTEGNIQSSCWSPCSSFVLFITSDDSILYRLQLVQNNFYADGNLSNRALPIADLSKCTVDCREVGGQPQQLAWDPEGLYLAISFKDTSCIAVFATCLQRFNLTISPAFFITGMSSEFPSYICFQSKTRRSKDPVLTIGWSSGRIQFFPFLNM